MQSVPRPVQVIFGISILILIVGILYTIFNYSQLPEEIPIHYNFKLEPDHFRPKKSIIFLFVIDAIVLLMIGAGIRYPETANYGRKLKEEDKPKVHERMQYLLAIVLLLFMLFSSYQLYRLF